MRYHLVTLGCPKNTVDSERLERLLAERRATPTVRPSDADLLIVNTCGFIDASKEESIDTILRLAAVKKPGQKLIAAGCMTQLYEGEVAQEIPEIDAIFGVDRWEDVAALATDERDAPYDIPLTSSPMLHRTSAYLKISDGCDAPCTFCIIPQIKGRLKSASAGQIVADARRLVAEGAKELVLVAQDSTAWGEDIGQHDALADLLRLLSAAVPEQPWLRIMYAYPSRVTPKLIAAMAELPNVLHYLDVPLQHGDEATLARMKRPHNLAKVRATVAALRAAMPDIALRTSIIVGFPGETEEQFASLKEFLAEIRFDHVGVFTYSPQEGTPAAALGDQLSEKTKKRRRAELMEQQQTIALASGRAQVGREQDVLIEAVSKQKGGDGLISVGRSYRDAPEVDGVTLVRGRFEPGSVVRVRVTQALAYDLIGEPVEAAVAAQMPS
jgi:ribosomal protein S12 methylthiotransferase